MRRRDLLAASLGGLLAPRLSHGFGPSSRVDIAELDLPGTQSRPNAWKRLLYEVVHTTSVECETRSVRLGPAEPELFEHPFCVLLGQDRFELPDTEGLQQLARYLSYGGFLFIDETSGAERSPFDDAVRELCSVLFPTRPLAPVPSDHSLYRAFFLIRRPVGRLDRFPQLEAITVGNVSPVVYCRNDLSGALDRRVDGSPAQAVVPGGERQRREAVKLGLNLVLYALTANYKKDQAHVAELIREGRLE